MKEKEIEKKRTLTHTFSIENREKFYRVGQPNSIKRFVGLFGAPCVHMLLDCLLILARSHAYIIST